MEFEIYAKYLNLIRGIAFPKKSQVIHPPKKISCIACYAFLGHLFYVLMQIDKLLFHCNIFSIERLPNAVSKNVEP